MNRLATRIFTLLAIVLVLPCAGQIPEDEMKEGPFVRVKMNEDGSRTIFRKSPDNRTMEKKTYSASGVLRGKTIYRMDRNGNPRGCKIYDGRGNELFKVGYGYDKTWGRLVEERMYDSRVKHIDPDTDKEMPVRRFIYTYTAQGERSKPISIVLRPGAKAEDIYGSGPSAYEKNPFDEPARKQANPRAKPVGRGR